MRSQAPAFLGRPLPGKPGERAGLAERDRVLSISGKPINTWADFTGEVAANPGKLLVLQVERAGKRFEVRVTPDIISEGSTRLGRLGIEAPAEVMQERERLMTTVRYGPVDALGKAIYKVYDLSVFSIKMLGRMIVGDVSWRNLSGPTVVRH